MARPKPRPREKRFRVVDLHGSYARSPMQKRAKAVRHETGIHTLHSAEAAHGPCSAPLPNAAIRPPGPRHPRGPRQGGLRSWHRREPSRARPPLQQRRRPPVLAPAEARSGGASNLERDSGIHPQLALTTLKVPAAASTSQPEWSPLAISSTSLTGPEAATSSGRDACSRLSWKAMRPRLESFLRQTIKSSRTAS